MRWSALILVMVALVAGVQWCQQQVLYRGSLTVTANIDPDGQVVEAQVVGASRSDPRVIAAINEVKRYALIVSENESAGLTTVTVGVDLWYRPWGRHWIAKARLMTLDPDRLQQIMSTASLFERAGCFLIILRKEARPKNYLWCLSPTDVSDALTARAESSTNRGRGKPVATAGPSS